MRPAAVLLLLALLAPLFLASLFPFRCRSDLIPTVCDFYTEPDPYAKDFVGPMWTILGKPYRCSVVDHLAYRLTSLFWLPCPLVLRLHCSLPRFLCTGASCWELSDLWIRLLMHLDGLPIALSWSLRCGVYVISNPSKGGNGLPIRNPAHLTVSALFSLTSKKV